MSTAFTPRDSCIPELDGIRGVAIGMVLIWHLYAGTVEVTPHTVRLADPNAISPAGASVL